MKISDESGKKSKRYTIALMGLSGVGKTTLSQMLPSDTWFHYSVDYRIWTHYLSDELNSYLQQLAAGNPLLQEMLAQKAITVTHRVDFDNLLATPHFMGMLGKPSENGSNEADFRERMIRHAAAEKAALLDVPSFKQRAEQRGRHNLLIDTGGSLCEVVEASDPHDPILRLLDEDCQLVYIRASERHKAELLKRQLANPKPIYYRLDFLDKHLPGLLKQFMAASVTDIHPKKVAGYLYPRLLDHRTRRYEAIAARQGFTIDMDDVPSLRTEQDLLNMLSDGRLDT